MQKQLQNVMKIFTLAVMLLAVNVMWGQTATYTVATTSSVTASGAPSGTSATYTQSFATTSQITNGNNAVLTLSGYAGKKITGIVLSMRSNSGGGGGNLTVLGGTTTIASIPTSTFQSTNWNGSYSTTYVNITPTVSSYTVGTGETVKITINANANSLYIQNYKITYESGFTVTFDKNAADATGTMANQTASTATNLTNNAFTRTGYNFSGWATSAAGTVAYANGASYPFTSSATLYAVWAATTTSPSLTAAPSATVDAPFNITFTDDAAWRAAITGITVGGTTLSASAYSVSAGQITFTPSAATLLQSAGSKAIVVSATGYNTASVTQVISAGVATKLALTTQPTAPATNGGVLATQPVVVIRDQYNNLTTSTAAVTATVGAGSWTIGGTPTANGVNGTATFTDLTATAATAVTGATITFAAPGLTSVTSAAFNIPGPAAPALTAAANATVDGPFIVTFTDNATWRSNITGITVGGTTLAASAYSVSAGQITFTPSASTLLQSSGTKAIVVIATGFANGTVSQLINPGAATKLALTTQPAAPATNGGALGTQPVVVIRDQYNNLTTSTAAVTAAVGAGAWTIGGTLTRNGVNGTATFTNLTATSAAAVNGATITFTSPGLTSITSNTFNIPIPAPANDNCSGAIALTLGATPVTGNVTGATQSLPAITCGTAGEADDDVWYSFTTGQAGKYTVTVTGSSGFDPVIDLRSGACNGTNIGCSDNSGQSGSESVTMTLSANTTYFVRVYDYFFSTPSNPTFTIGVSPAAPVATAATNIGLNGFTANWNTVPNATGYKLDIATSPGFVTSILTDNFSGFTSNTGQNVSGQLNSYMQATGWTGAYVFNFTGYAKMGSSNDGVITTPTVDLSGTTTKTLTFDVAQFSSAVTIEVLHASNGTNFSVIATIAVPVSFTTQTVSITGGTANSKIRIQTKSGQTEQRFFLDNFNLSSSTIVPEFSNISVAGNSLTVNTLAEYTNYYYRVRTVAPAGTSDSSNAITVKTAGTLTWNGTQWMAGATVASEPRVIDNGIIAGSYTAPATTGLTINNLTVNSVGSVNIPSNRTITVAGTLTNNAPASNFTVQDNGALVQTATGTATNTTPITVIKNTNPLYRFDYTLWSSPVAGQTMRLFSMGTSNNRFYEYKMEAGDEGYYPIENIFTTTFTAGKSYLIRMPNSIQSNVTGTTNGGITTPAEYAAGAGNYIFEGKFTGTPYTGDITYNAATATSEYCATGNPYPSPINIAAFYAANAAIIDGSSAIYFWRKRNNTDTSSSSYASITLADFNFTPNTGSTGTGGQDNLAYYTGNSANWVLAPGQGFIVKTTGNITYNNAMRRAAPLEGGQGFFKSGASQVSRFRMKVTAPEGDAGQMSVVYMPQGTMGLDYSLDGKLLGDASLAIYTLAENTPLSIQARPEFDVTDVVPAGFTANTSGSFTIALSHTDGVFANGQKVYLKDKAEGIVRDMAQGDYTFTTEAGTFNDRFEIVYTTAALGVDTPVLDANTVIVYQNGSTINVNSGSAVINSINVFDIRGRKLFTFDKVNASEAAIDNLTAAKQVLIVEINTDKGTVTKKIVF